MEELAPGLWRFTARHPDWHPKGFGDEVAGFALEGEDGLVLIDPLVGDADGQARLDELADGRQVTVFVTIPYHVRSAAELARRWERVEVLGHAAVARRLPAGTPFRAMEPGERLPHGAQAFAIGRPRRYELPVYLPEFRALAFGDAVVGAEGGLRVWIQEERTDSWLRERFLPTLEPLAELDVERVLVTHGPPVLTDGVSELRAAIAAGAWSRR